jgi:hypothetical protein
LAQGIYDPHRDVYYFTDANRIQVFSKTQRAWLAPFNIPAPQGASQRLWGIALSPNGSKLAVSDVLAGVIYVLDPTNPGSVKTFAVNAQNVGLEFPTGVAISDSGNVYYTVMWNGISGGRGFFKLDTNTGQILDYNIAGPGGPNDVYLRAVISSDNSRVFFNDDGWPFYVDTATDKFYGATVSPACCYGDYELSLAANQSTVEATGYLYDLSLNAQSAYASNVREALNIGYIYGAKLSADGRLLFQPTTIGIDVLDGRLGNLLQRIALPVQLSPNDDALVSDGKDNILVAVIGKNGDGIAAIDLSAIQEPAPLPYANKSRYRQNDSRATGSATLGSGLPIRPHASAVRPIFPGTNIQHVTERVMFSPSPSKAPKSTR